MAPKFHLVRSAVALMEVHWNVIFTFSESCLDVFHEWMVKDRQTFNSQCGLWEETAPRRKKAAKLAKLLTLKHGKSKSSFRTKFQVIAFTYQIFFLGKKGVFPDDPWFDFVTCRETNQPASCGEGIVLLILPEAGGSRHYCCHLQNITTAATSWLFRRIQSSVHVISALQHRSWGQETALEGKPCMSM